MIKMKFYTKVNIYIDQGTLIMNFAVKDQRSSLVKNHVDWANIKQSWGEAQDFSEGKVKRIRY